ncbi:hypothetical protein EV175_007273, partial [Coemansia sp. RSA 1933]
AHKAGFHGIRRQVKEAIATNQWGQAILCPEARAIIELLAPIRDAYPGTYKFEKGSIYYDVKANPSQHIKAYYLLMTICEQEKVKTKQCFPLSTGWVPGHMCIDLKILCEKFLHCQPGPKSEANRFWAAAVEVGRRPFKDTSSSKFSGSIVTDGVSVSILREITTDKVVSGSSEVNSKVNSKVNGELDCPYIEEIP